MRPNTVGIESAESIRPVFQDYQDYVIKLVISRF
jgi:hypothetical protein